MAKLDEPCVYMLLCNDNTLYTGWTNNINMRVEAHTAKKGAKYTKYRLPLKLVYVEKCDTKSIALKRELEIKRLNKLQKLELINKFNDVTVVRPAFPNT